MLDGTVRSALGAKTPHFIQLERERCWRQRLTAVLALLLRVTKTDRVVQVFNLVLNDSELFVAGGFLARSKPPATNGELPAE